MDDGFPYQTQPSGWFQLGWSQDFAPGDVKPLRYFGQDLVGYRGESGTLYVFDAHCPHLGAHLGYGGAVVQDDIVCPFHGWRWDSHGRNVDIPYSDRVRKQKTLAGWHVREQDGLIWLWHDSERSDPTWEVPDIPELRDDTYFHPHPEARAVIDLRIRPQFITENAADIAHFQYIHKWLGPASEEFYETEGPRFHNVLVGRIPTPKGVNDVRVENDVWGPGITISRLTGVVQGRDLVAIVASTPVDEVHCNVHLSAAVRKPPNHQGEKMDSTGLALAKANEREVGEHDGPIWNNMRYVARPPFTAEEAKSYSALRRWAIQFYPNEKEPEATS